MGSGRFADFSIFWYGVSQGSMEVAFLELIG
jgi:hypothetical protein